MPKASNRRRRPRDDDSDVQQSGDTSHSVLGGMKGGYRLTGDERAAQDGDVHQFKIPFNGKSIICERRGDGQRPALIFTHGAGGGIANLATSAFAEGFAEVASVTTFQGTMNLQSRIKSFHTVVGHEQVDCALGGRSMGARAAVLTAQQSERTIKELILVSFPMFQFTVQLCMRVGH